MDKLPPPAFCAALLCGESSFNAREGPGESKPARHLGPSAGLKRILSLKVKGLQGQSVPLKKTINGIENLSFR